MITVDSSTPARTAPTPVRRLLNVAKLHVANPATVIVTPLLILATIFVLNWLIWLLLTATLPSGGELAAGDGTEWSGAVSFVFVYMLVVAVQAMNATFPLALGYGATRRDFYLGSALAFVLLSAGWALLLGAFGLLEDLTGGWGLGGTMFRSVIFGDGGALERTWVFFVLLLFFFFTGSAVAALYVRWRHYGLISYFAVVAFAVVGVVALIVLTDSGGLIVDTLRSLGFAGSYALLLIPTLISAIAGFGLLRGATPRN